MDVVRDFDGAAGDRLDISALADGRFAFIGTGAFAATGPQVRYSVGATGVRVDVSTDGGPADFSIFLRGATSLGAGDFLL
jgi:hypothetical protein